MICDSNPLPSLGNAPPSQSVLYRDKYAFIFSTFLIVASLSGIAVGLGGYFNIGLLSQLQLTSATSLFLIIFSSASLVITVTLLIAHLTSSSRTQYPPPPLYRPMENFIDYVNLYHSSSISDNIHGVYVLSNETGIEDTLDGIIPLYSDRAESARCHIGTGGLHNFDIMATRHSSYGVLIDFNPQNKLFIEAALNFIRQSESPAQFVELIVAYMNLGYQEYNHYPNDLSPILRIQAEVNRTTSWLSTQDKFNHIKNLALNNRICAITQDLCNTPLLGAFLDHLPRDFQCIIDTAYLSNISGFIANEKFRCILGILSSHQAIIIESTRPKNCPCQGGCMCPKQQRIRN